MNTVWEVMEEPKEFAGHILFGEEDHYMIFKRLLKTKVGIGVKPMKCP